MNLTSAVRILICFLISIRSAEVVNFYGLLKEGRIKDSINFIKNSPESFLLNSAHLRDASDYDLHRLADELFSEIQSALIFHNQPDEKYVGLLVNNLNVLMSEKRVRDKYRLTYELLSSLVDMGNDELLSSFVGGRRPDLSPERTLKLISMAMIKKNPLMVETIASASSLSFRDLFSFVRKLSKREKKHVHLLLKLIINAGLIIHGIKPFELATLFEFGLKLCPRKRQDVFHKRFIETLRACSMEELELLKSRCVGKNMIFVTAWIEEFMLPKQIVDVSETFAESLLNLDKASIMKLIKDPYSTIDPANLSQALDVDLDLSSLALAHAAIDEALKLYENCKDLAKREDCFEKAFGLLSVDQLKRTYSNPSALRVALLNSSSRLGLFLLSQCPSLDLGKDIGFELLFTAVDNFQDWAYYPIAMRTTVPFSEVLSAMFRWSKSNNPFALRHLWEYAPTIIESFDLKTQLFLAEYLLQLCNFHLSALQLVQSCVKWSPVGYDPNFDLYNFYRSKFESSTMYTIQEYVEAFKKMMGDMVAGLKLNYLDSPVGEDLKFAEQSNFCLVHEILSTIINESQELPEVKVSGIPLDVENLD